MKYSTKHDTRMLISVSCPHDARAYFYESASIKQIFESFNTRFFFYKKPVYKKL